MARDNRRDGGERSFMKNLTLGETALSLHEALRDYIEATYHISNQMLVDQRRVLLDLPGVIRQIPYVESTPRYASGGAFQDLGLPSAAAEILAIAASAEHDGNPLIHNPPYQHQAEALQQVLIRRGSAVVTTGTGSGKTECFLLPILGHLGIQAASSPGAFQIPALRAILLYPMNALVNDQLGRLRVLFGSEALSKWFSATGGRPARFARYTSRTLYPGVRTAKRDQTRLRPLGQYYVDAARAALDPESSEYQASRTLIDELQRRGKWPSKPDLLGWYGAPGSRWQGPDGRFQRCVTLPADPELLTRHEVLENAPDILVTNYSMLEYMLMRPLERPLFDATRDWLAANPNETILLVVDEAHLYRGSAGAEVALLIRRLRDRLGISADRMQVICTTATFGDRSRVPEFAASLTGKLPADFQSITGQLATHETAHAGTNDEATILAAIDLSLFYQAADDERLQLIEPVLAMRSVVDSDPRTALFAALRDYPPMNLLINTTMRAANPVSALGTLLFPETPPGLGEKAATNLVALGSYAREAGQIDGPGLLPSRLHTFFRGLAGLWVCLDPSCSEIPPAHRGGPVGRLYEQPTSRCACGARVFELFTCRHCGTAYCRAYTDDIEDPHFLWATQGQGFLSATGAVQPLAAIDLLLGEPVASSDARPVDLDIVTGRIDPQRLGDRTRNVFLAPQAEGGTASGEFVPCAVCGKSAAFGRSSVQDHQTKGDEPFQALVTRQIEVQQPTAAPTYLAPMAGRKVLVFSDSRQTAARLAPNLQKYTTRDAVRPLLLLGYSSLASDPEVGGLVSLEESYAAVLLAMATLGVRLRPTTRVGDTFDADLGSARAFVEGGMGDPDAKRELLFDLRTRNPPEQILAAIHSVTNDPYYGFLSLALASIAPKKDVMLESVPAIPPAIETAADKRALLSIWLNEWRGQWLRATPTTWADSEIRSQSGKFPALMKRVLPSPASRRIFQDHWLAPLLETYADPVGGEYRLKGSSLTLEIGGDWGYCQTCRSTQRPLPRDATLCVRCGRPTLEIIDPDENAVFAARKNYYRRGAVLALRDGRQPIALVAAEHTAQLNEAQADAVFSEAEENELLFQDVDLGNGQPAIDVLSCTTTMEVGIDIGALAGVALRNMPPSRANYQQRAGRAGRRGKAIATVTSFASSQGHDEYSFGAPDQVIRGTVVDPEMSLDNWQIAKRHLAAFVIQQYLIARLPTESAGVAGYGVHLFEVLGTVSGFLSSGAVLNRTDFQSWLESEAGVLSTRAQAWLPSQLPHVDELDWVLNAVREIGPAVDEAIDWFSVPVAAETGEADADTDNVSLEPDTPAVEVPAEVGDAAPGADPAPETLLGRLLYRGILPRYAFPTDVATFHVFDSEATTSYRPVFRYTPSQGMAAALSQYAPGKRVWIGGREWYSGALYSRFPEDRFHAWEQRRLYFECATCHYAITTELDEGARGESRQCPACGASEDLGPAQTWLKPPGFAHPWYRSEVTSPEDEPPPSYATRAKLTAPTPADPGAWKEANERIALHFDRLPLLVTNRGPRDEGYSYCTICGLIEPSSTVHSAIVPGHQKPFPDRREPVCRGGRTAQSLVLGTDFISDVLLISLRVQDPLTLRPEFESTRVALRTLSEALTVQAARMLGLGMGELQAEFRTALTPRGRSGAESEIYMYDTLAGGAGYSQRVGNIGLGLFEETLQLLDSCPGSCDSSCYRCLRSYRNQFEHSLLDRHIGGSLLRYLLTGERPDIAPERAVGSTNLLFQDLDGYGLQDLVLTANSPVDVPGFGRLVAPILAVRNGQQPVVVVLHHPFAPTVPLAAEWAEPADLVADLAVLQVDELAVRRNLPSVSGNILRRLGYEV